MARSLTTRQLLSGVRSLIDEMNEAEIDDELDLLPSLNRGLDDAVDILARKYPDALIKPLDVDLNSGVNGLFDLPKDAFQERLEKVEAQLNGYYSEVQRIDYRDITPYDVPSSSSTPYYYAVIGSQYRLVPPPASVQGLRIWYIPEVGPLVKEYGRITVTGVDNSLPTQRSYVRVTDVVDPTQVSQDVSTLESFVNLIDHRTGRIKATLQIASISGSKLIFSASPTRTMVQGRTVVGALPASAELDDYLCPVDGTCIPPMRSPLSNFLITYASAEIKALKLDGDPNVVLAQLKKFEERIDRTWVRREQSLRVGKSSRNWGGANSARLWARTPRS
jgi:hypothetical protein